VRRRGNDEPGLALTLDSTSPNARVSIMVKAR
jgi:hypothetical protein